MAVKLSAGQTLEAGDIGFLSDEIHCADLSDPAPVQLYKSDGTLFPGATMKRACYPNIPIFVTSALKPGKPFDIVLKHDVLEDGTVANVGVFQTTKINPILFVEVQKLIKRSISALENTVYDTDSLDMETKDNGVGLLRSLRILKNDVSGPNN